jgi:hypothetical protein
LADSPYRCRDESFREGYSDFRVWRKSCFGTSMLESDRRRITRWRAWLSSTAGCAENETHTCLDKAM